MKLDLLFTQRTSLSVVVTFPVMQYDRKTRLYSDPINLMHVRVRTST